MTDRKCQCNSSKSDKLHTVHTTVFIKNDLPPGFQRDSDCMAAAGRFHLEDQDNMTACFLM